MNLNSKISIKLRNLLLELRRLRDILRIFV
jgi:hypothetical protein